jgi:hypothetical protein
LASENVLQEVFLTSFGQLAFKSVKDYVQEFLGVLLLSHIDGVSTEVFESEAELSCIVVLSL